MRESVCDRRERLRSRVGRSRSGSVFDTPFGPSLGLGLGPVSVHLGHGPVRS